MLFFQELLPLCQFDSKKTKTKRLDKEIPREINTMSDSKTGVAWDRCAEDLIMKFGVGVLGLGLAGAVLFKSPHLKVASAAFGAGTGSGFALAGCEGLLKGAKADNRSKLVASRR